MALAQRTQPTLDRAARVLLMSNTRRRELAGRRGRFSVPAPDHYPFQWFWDSCFHAVVWAAIDRERAADELRSLLAWQRPDGMIPHVVFWDQSKITLAKFWHYTEASGIPFVRRPKTSECVQPPVIARAAEAIGGDFVDEALPAIGRFFRYLARERDPDGDGLVSIVNQFESGLDYSPTYEHGVHHRNPVSLFLASRRGEVTNKLLRFDLDRIFRYTDHHVEDVLFNTVYADGLETVARLADGRDEELATWARERATHVTKALVEQCYDESCGLFFNLRGRSGRRAKQRTVASIVPILLPGLPSEIAERLVGHLRDPHTFGAPYPVPSVPLDDPRFSRRSRAWGVRFIWRGPCSMNTNWFVADGLRRHGFGDDADVLVSRSHELVARGGFNEFYDPLDGSPVGAKNFGWATLACVM